MGYVHGKGLGKKGEVKFNFIHLSAIGNCTFSTKTKIKNSDLYIFQINIMSNVLDLLLEYKYVLYSYGIFYCSGIYVTAALFLLIQY